MTLWAAPALPGHIYTPTRGAPMPRLVLCVYHRDGDLWVDYQRDGENGTMRKSSWAAWRSSRSPTVSVDTEWEALANVQ